MNGDQRLPRDDHVATETRGQRRSAARLRSASQDHGTRTLTTSGAALATAALVVAVAYVGDLDPEIGRKLALLAWGIVSLAALSGLLGDRRPSGASRPLLVALAFASAVTALGLLTTPSAERTADELSRVTGFAGFALLAALVIRRRNWQGVAAGLAGGAAAVCGLALLSRVLPDILAGDPSSGARLSYPFGYWNALAAWSSITLAMLVAWSVDGRDRAARSLATAALPLALSCIYLSQSRGGFLTALVGVVTVGLMSRHKARIAVYVGVAALATAAAMVVLELHDEIASATGAYGGPVVALSLMAACGVAWLVPRAFLLRRRESVDGDRVIKPRAKAPLGKRVALGIVGAALSVIVAVPLAYALLGSDEPVAADLPAASSARLLSLEGNRALYWEEALDAFAANPLDGIGPGTYEYWWSQNGRGPEEVRDAHSFYFEGMAEGGILGLAAAILIGATMLWAALGPSRRGEVGAAAIGLPAGVAVLVTYLAIDWIWESHQVMLLGIACAVTAAASGTASRTSSSARGSTRRRRKRRPQTRWPVAVAFAAIAVAGVALQIPGLVSASRIESAARANLSGLDERALESADDAIAAEPWAATPYAARANIHFGAERFDQAIVDLRSASERDPENFRWPLAIAHSEVRLGNAAAARDAFEDARSLAPRSAGVTGPAGIALDAQISALEEPTGVQP